MDHERGKTESTDAADTGLNSEQSEQESHAAPEMEDQDAELADIYEKETEAVLSEMELNEVIENICNSKAEEFRMLGYEHVTGREVWECVSDKYHKTGVPPLHKVVNDILSLKVTQFMNWMTMSIYKTNPFK
jgi:Post-transcriptional regulator